MPESRKAKARVHPLNRQVPVPIPFWDGLGSSLCRFARKARGSLPEVHTRHWRSEETRTHRAWPALRSFRNQGSAYVISSPLSCTQEAVLGTQGVWLMRIMLGRRPPSPPCCTFAARPRGTPCPTAFLAVLTSSLIASLIAGCDSSMSESVCRSREDSARERVA